MLQDALIKVQQARDPGKLRGSCNCSTRGWKVLLRGGRRQETGQQPRALQVECGKSREERGGGLHCWGWGWEVGGHVLEHGVFERPCSTNLLGSTSNGERLILCIAVEISGGHRLVPATVVPVSLVRNILV